MVDSEESQVEWKDTVKWGWMHLFIYLFIHLSFLNLDNEKPITL